MSKTFLIILIILYKTVKMSVFFLARVFIEVVVLSLITLIYFLKIPYLYWLFKKFLNYKSFLFFFFKIPILFLLVILFFLAFIPLIFLFYNWRDYVKFYGFILDYTIYAIPTSYTVCLLAIPLFYFIYQKIKNRSKHKK
jgi:hypothetical protein